jgi:hypothetical protein
MTRTLNPWFVAIPLLALGCGGSSRKEAAPTQDAGPAEDGGPIDHDGGTTPGNDATPPAANNVAPLVVSAGPPGTASADVPFVDVTLCVPGTTNCQTINYVSVDTGSSGLRFIASAVPSSLALPQALATTGDSLAECFQFADGYTWGSVRLADVKIAGEVAAKIPIHLIGDPNFGTVPSDCSSSGSPEDTVADFGSNGLIGINQFIPDCGDSCADPSDIQPGTYYSCSGGTCAGVAVADAAQVSNPIAFFDTDKNGAVVQFPTVAAAGAPMLAGTLLFGIGTQSNNGLGSAKVQTVDVNGNFTTVYKGQTFNTSFLDSGTNSFSFNDSSIPQCSGELAGFYCPTSTLNLTAQNTGLNEVMTTVSFSVASTQTLFSNQSYAVFDDLGTTGIDNNSFDWGFPFFIGRNVFVAIDGASTPGGSGPYFAY